MKYYDMDLICARCGETYGEHKYKDCPDGTKDRPAKHPAKQSNQQRSWLALLIILALVLLTLLGWQQARYINTLQRAVIQLQLRALGPDTQEEQDRQFDFWPNQNESLFKI